MKIIDLTKEYEHLYFICLEDWSSDMKESGDHKQRWYTAMKQKGLKVKLALDDAGTLCGMIEYLPIEYSIADGKDLYFINCIWVHKHKQGIGDQRNQGFGKALLSAAEEDAAAMGALGMGAYGVTMPFWIPVAWFKKRGYVPIEKDGIARLLFKPFSDKAQPPVLITQKKTPSKIDTTGKVAVTALINGYCPSQNIVFERAKRACAAFGDQVIFKPVDTSERNTFMEWGILNGLFVADKLISTGPPLSFEKIKKSIAKAVKKLR